MNDELISTGKAAKMLGVTTQTIRRYIKAGVFGEVVMIGSGGKSVARIRKSAIDDYKTASSVDYFRYSNSQEIKKEDNN